MSARLDLAGQIAIVTGGGRGVGRSIALALAARGAAVTVAARSKSALEEVTATIRREGGRAIAVPADVTDESAVASLVAETEAELGQPTLLVNNAGTWRQLGPLQDADPKAWWSDVEVSLKGSFLCTRALLPGMLNRAAGRIVNVSSYAANEPRPFWIGYAAGKAALLRFTDSLAAELERTGVHVFAVTPGFVRTDMVEGIAASEAGRRFLPGLADRQDALEPGRAGQLVVEIASGRLDPLAGRFLHVLDDLDDLLARVDEIEEHDLYTLRLRTPRQSR